MDEHDRINCHPFYRNDINYSLHLGNLSKIDRENNPAIKNLRKDRILIPINTFRKPSSFFPWPR